MGLFSKKKKDNEIDDDELIRLASSGAAPDHEFALPDLGGDNDLIRDAFSSDDGGGGKGTAEEDALLSQYLTGGDAGVETPTSAPEADDDLLSALSAPDGDDPGETSDVGGLLGLTDDGDDFSDDFMAIFESEDEGDEELDALTAGLEQIEAASLLSHARQVSSQLHDMIR